MERISLDRSARALGLVWEEALGFIELLSAVIS
jgi:hypothetical protein